MPQSQKRIRQLDESLPPGLCTEKSEKWNDPGCTKWLDLSGWLHSTAQRMLWGSRFGFAAREEIAQDALQSLAREADAGRHATEQAEAGAARARIIVTLESRFLDCARKDRKWLAAILAAEVIAPLAGSNGAAGPNDGVDAPLVLRLLDRLPKDAVDVLQLHARGFTFPRIAFVLAMSEDAARMRRNRAVDQLRAWYRKEVDSRVGHPLEGGSDV